MSANNMRRKVILYEDEGIKQSDIDGPVEEETRCV